MMRFSACFALLPLLPLPLLAEGATITYRCDVGLDTAQTFVFAPQFLDENRMGKVEVTHGDTVAVGTMSGDFGPWSWNAGGVISALLIDGAEGDRITMLLHELDTNLSPPSSTSTFLTCEAPA